MAAINLSLLPATAMETFLISVAFVVEMTQHAEDVPISTLVTTMKTLSTMMELASSWIAMVIAVERRFWMRVAFATDQAPFTSVVVKTFQWEIAIATATSWMLVAFVEEMARLALVAPTRQHATMTKLRPLTMAHA